VRRYDFHAHDQGMSGDGCWGRHYGITGALYVEGRMGMAIPGLCVARAGPCGFMGGDRSCTMYPHDY
jgi:hypothetical protein